MSNNVFADGNAIACKAGDNKVIAAFPDVCLSPPSPPAGPVPVPYPDTSFSKDMKDGSKTVMINGKEVMLKDKSFYKTSPLGDEAATRSFGANVVSHVITGKTYFRAWSMDVKFEGENVDRHIDPTTSNHASEGPGAPPPLPAAETAAVAAPPAETEACTEAKKEKKKKCGSKGKPKEGIKPIPAPWPSLDCKPSSSPKTLAKSKVSPDLPKKIKGIEDCLKARQAVTDNCFGGVTDAVHAEQESQLKAGLKNARDLQASK